MNQQDPPKREGRTSLEALGLKQGEALLPRTVQIKVSIDPQAPKFDI